LTGGVQGICCRRPEVCRSALPLNEEQWLYYYCMVVRCCWYWAAANIMKQPQRERHDGDPRPVLAADPMGHRHRPLQTVTVGIRRH